MDFERVNIKGGSAYEDVAGYSRIVKAGPLVWLAVTLKLAHFFISEVAQVFIRNRTLDFTNAEDVFLRSIKNLQ